MVIGPLFLTRRIGGLGSDFEEGSTSTGASPPSLPVPTPHLYRTCLVLRRDYLTEVHCQELFPVCFRYEGKPQAQAKSVVVYCSY